MFYGRKTELEILEKTFKEPNKCVALYGKRRVGKTSLIFNFNKGKKTFIYFECIKDTLEENAQLFLNQCKLCGVIFPAYFKTNNFKDIFEYLNNLPDDFIIAIDEYPYLKTFNDSNMVDSFFQVIIDNYLKNIDLILSGSEVKMMEQLINSDNPLYGRFSHTLFLNELNYLESANFYLEKNEYDRVAFFSVFGGSPFINSYINPSKNLKENIVDTFLKIGSAVYNYADSILVSDVVNEIHAKRILSFLGNGKKKYKELIDALDKNKTGIINRSLTSLTNLRLIKKITPINEKENYKKTHYEMNDNVLRFYFTYIYKNKSQLELLGQEAFFEEYIAPTLTNFISYRFEEQCRNYFSILVNQGKLEGIKDIGSYYYDDIENKTNGEFDVALKTKDSYQIYEVKYLNKPLGGKEIIEEIMQIKKIKNLYIDKIGFISINGFSKNSGDLPCISGKDIYFL